MRRLIINADDLGLTPGVNQAILHSAVARIVTSSTLMASGPALEDAVARLGSFPAGFSIGCHLSLVDGKPVSSPSQVPSLVNGGKEFRRSIAHFAIAACNRKLEPREIEVEALAQFQSLLSSGVKLSHFDAHKHAHMFPQVLEPALKAADRCGIRAVRNPFEPSRSLPLAILGRYPKLFKRYLQVKLLAGMRTKWRSIVRRFGFATPDGSLGVIVTGDLDRTLLRAMLEAMPEGTWELVCHPGYNDGDLATVDTRLRASREQEFALLTSPELPELLATLGIELISYHDL